MTRQARRWVAALALLECTGCGSSSGNDTSQSDEIAQGVRYDGDPEYRRNQLVDSIVNPNNAYSALRLSRYTAAGWGALPEWNPHVSAVDLQRAQPPASPSDAWSRASIDDVPWERDALLELGRKAFFGYPVQVFTPLRVLLGGPDFMPRHGFWADGSRLGGALWTQLPSGQVEPALTCASCHASSENDRIIAGKNNAQIDLEAASAEYYGGVAASTGHEGRLDVTADGRDNPTTVGDLRAVRSQTNLHRAATLKNGLIPLAVRIETLIITSLGESVRPPRKLAFALALYLWNLEPTPLLQTNERTSRGQRLFSERCAGCHRPPSFSGPSVPLDVVGTDRSVGESPDRFTGNYRVPSLRGVGDRQRLFANGAVFDVRELLDPSRAAPGHPFGLDLPAEGREELLAYLATL
ncbi:MAG TPA: hypothetical protein VK524_00330 [Polyangiaceae bacterium]|nr:hypothetical protein [Polyangiaceae bacterium]